MAKTKSNIKPLHDNVLVRPLEAEDKTAGGIILPDSAKEKPQMGEVMATGPGTKKHEMTVKVGDKVMYKKWGGNEVKIDGKEWTMVEVKDILAIVN